MHGSDDPNLISLYEIVQYGASHGKGFDIQTDVLPGHRTNKISILGAFFSRYPTNPVDRWHQIAERTR